MMLFSKGSIKVKILAIKQNTKLPIVPFLWQNVHFDFTKAIQWRINIAFFLK